MSGETGLRINADPARWQELRDHLLAEFRPLIHRRCVVYLDYPAHDNFGDQLVHLGTLKLFRQLKCRMKGAYSIEDVEAFWRRDIPEDWVIVLHGGGNFGDLYPWHQRLREEAIRRYPNNPVVLMPQSVHFNEPDRFASQSAVFRGHRNLKLYVRDRESLAFLGGFLDPSQLGLAPDVATMLIDEWRANMDRSAVLRLRRRDCEAVGSAESGSFDWDDLYTEIDWKFMGKLGPLARLTVRHDLPIPVHALWVMLIRRWARRAVAHYRRFGEVDTDRLHGAIMAWVLGMPATLSDNCYGKLSRYTNCWLI